MIVLPPELAAHDGFVSGLTATSELLVEQTWHTDPAPHEIVRQDVSIWDRESGATETIVSRRAPAGQVATSQIVGTTANADWVVWVEIVGFDIGGDWSVWAFDRHAHSIRKVAQLEPGRYGIPPTGWIGDVSLLGDVAAWAAPYKTAPKRIESRVYVANLGKGTLRRLSENANYPQVLSPNKVAAAVAVGSDGNGLLAQPALFDVRADTAAVQTWVEPARVLGFAAGPAGMIEMRMLREATAEVPVVLADVVIHDRDGITRAFGMPDDFGPVNEADGVLFWQDALHLWALPSGQAQPTLLAETPDDLTAYGVMTNAGNVLWGTGSIRGSSSSSTLRLLHAECP